MYVVINEMTINLHFLLPKYATKRDAVPVR